MSLFGVRRHPGATPLPSEGRLPGFDSATGWLNSAPLTSEELRGKVVLVDFWTYTSYFRGGAPGIPPQTSTPAARRPKPPAAAVPG